MNGDDICVTIEKKKKNYSLQQVSDLEAVGDLVEGQAEHLPLKEIN